MGELEPDDSRDVTLTDHQAPGEPPRTGPREGETRGDKGSSDKTDWRTDPEGRTQNQSQTNDGSWRDTEKDRDAQDHDKAGGIAGPSPRPEADDGQWSQDPEKFAVADDDYDAPTQPMQGWYEEEDVIRFGAAIRDMMRAPHPARQAYQAERGGR
jgi:hypothetical protein